MAAPEVLHGGSRRQASLEICGGSAESDVPEVRHEPDPESGAKRLMSARLLKTREVAEMLQVSSQTVLNWTDRGVLPGGHRLPHGPLRFDAATVDAWLRDRAVGSPKPDLKEAS